MKNLPQQVAIVVVGLIISALAWIPIAVGHDPKPKAGQEPHETHDKAHDGHKHGDRHNHATVPACTGSRTNDLWRPMRLLPVKPASFADKAMVSSMTPAYWFWRLSEGAAVEPFRAAGSAMPAWKNELSVEDRWAVIVYQHALSGHQGTHDATGHPELGTVEGRSHPEPRGVAFGSAWVTRDHRAQPRGLWRYAIQKELPQLYREFNGIGRRTGRADAEPARPRSREDVRLGARVPSQPL
jgi:hypothetical protein